VNTDDGKMLRTYSGSADFMYTIATTPDGLLAISGGQDSTLLVWLVGDGQLLQSLKAPAPADSATQQAANN
jgi:hypothetical protein